MSYTPTARERYLELCAEPAPRRPRPPRPPRPTIAPPPRLALPSILDDVARVFAVEPAALAGRSRLPATVAARQAAMLVLREHYRLSLPVIGSMLGRDHSTVHHGVAVAAARRDRDAGYAAQIAALVEGAQMSSITATTPEPEPDYTGRQVRITSGPHAGRTGRVAMLYYDWQPGIDLLSIEVEAGDYVPATSRIVELVTEGGQP